MWRSLDEGTSAFFWVPAVSGGPCGEGRTRTGGSPFASTYVGVHGSICVSFTVRRGGRDLSLLSLGDDALLFLGGLPGRPLAGRLYRMHVRLRDGHRSRFRIVRVYQVTVVRLSVSMNLGFLRYPLLPGALGHVFSARTQCVR